MSNRIKKFDGGGEVGGAQNATVTLADGTVVTRGFLDWLAKNSASNYDSAAANIFGDYDFEGETEADIPVWQQMRDKLNALEGMTGTDAGDLYKELGGFGSTFDPSAGTTGSIQSAMEMFLETYAEAKAADRAESIDNTAYRYMFTDDPYEALKQTERRIESVRGFGGDTSWLEENRKLAQADIDALSTSEDTPDWLDTSTPPT
jgi:hypothetical protein